MSTTHRFTKQDIGPEILPILTNGLYRDSLDAIREYIQNGIDAGDPDIVTIRDNGHGMSEDVAIQAKRLGVSTKNPNEDIGFRGIGIYSAFNLCDSAQIITRSDKNSPEYSINFDFKGMRRRLQEEQRRKTEGLPPLLYLERLLSETVSVQRSQGNVVVDHGTVVILGGLLSDAYARINDGDAVIEYLQNVVALPFRHDFKYGQQIIQKFAAEDYEVVSLSVKLLGVTTSLYRPYKDTLFTNSGIHEPQFFQLSQGSIKFGFAWVCVNDARETIKDLKVRGLLIKKRGFSVSDRRYLEPFFGRTTVSRRITGEIIVTHPDLIPNAARSDFEHNTVRMLFHETLTKFALQVDKWVNKIQDDEKARDILNKVTQELLILDPQLLKAQRDRERLIEINTEIADKVRRLKPHLKRLESLEPEPLRVTKNLLDEIQSFVKTALLSQRRVSSKMETEVIRSVQRSTSALKIQQPKHVSADITTLSQVLESYGMLESESIRKAIAFFDEAVIRPIMSTDEYIAGLRELDQYLEENA